MGDAKDVKHWSGDVRSDGLAVEAHADGTFVVTGHPRWPPLLACPCCHKPFRTALAAKLAADVVSPVRFPAFLDDPPE